MKKGVASMTKRIGAWILTLVMIAGLVAVPAGEAKAAEDSIGLTIEKPSESTEADDNNNVDVNISSPSGYGTVQDLLDAGYTKFQLKYEVSEYTQASSGTAGIQLYVAWGDKYTYATGGWTNLSSGKSGVLEMDLSEITGKSEELKRFGVQIANVTGAVAYKVSDATLVKGNASQPGGTGGKEPTVSENGENVDGTSMTLSKATGSNDYYDEWSFTFTNQTGADITGIEMVIKTSKEVQPNGYGVSASYDAEVGGIRVYYAGTVRNGETLAASSERKIGYSKQQGETVQRGCYVRAVNCKEEIVTDNNLDLELEYNYAKLLQYSLYFYDANMCGTDVGESSALSWRDDCHTGEASVKKTINGKEYTLDVSGGYHDAGDHVKFGLPQAYSASVLGLGYYYFRDAYDSLGQSAHLKNILDRFAAYFEHCTVLDGDQVVAFCYQVGDGNADHGYWGPAEKQEAAQGERDKDVYLTDSSTPCTDIVAESAAALAIYAAVYQNTDPSNAEKALDYAKKLLNYAESNNKDASAKSQAANFYNGASYNDDLALASIWIHNAIGDSDTTYMNKYNTYVQSCSDGWLLSWDDVSAAAYLAGGSTYANKVESIMSKMKDKDKTPQGFTCVDGSWGSARYNTALQFTGLAYDKLLSKSSYGDWATSQMKYLLGNNNAKQCYVIGYNENDPKHPHHRSASGYDDVNSHKADPMKYTLYGALVGGPNASDNYIDLANEYQYAEVALDYNAAFVGAAAALYLIHQQDGQQSLVTEGLKDVKTYYVKSDDPLEGITLNKKEVSLSVDDTAELNVVLDPITAAYNEISWSCEPSDVVSITDKGKTAVLTALKSGEATITVKVTSEGETYSDTCTVKVVNPVTSFTLEDSDITLEKGEARQLGYTISPEKPDDYTIEWKSENSDVATVKDGKVQAVGKGVTTITATLKSGSQIFTEECKVTVTVPLESISMAPKTLELQLHGDNSTAKLAVTPIPKDAVLGDVQWSVSPKDVVAIEEDGSGTSVKITAVAKGEAVITATAGGKSVKCSVTVTNSVTEIRLPATLEVLISEIDDNPIDLSEQLEYIPEGADRQKVKWTSSDPDAIQVDSDGKVTIEKKEKGVTAEITAVLESNEDIKAVCTISIVGTPVESITVTPKKMYLSLEHTKSLTATVTPEDADNAGNIKWVSLNPDVASVDDKGKVTALKEGEAEIQASAGNKKASCTVTVLDPYTIDVSKLGDPEYADALVSDDNSPTVSYDSENKKLTLKEPQPSKYTITGENDEVTIVTGGKEEYDVTLKDVTVKQVDVSASTKGKMHIEGQVTVKEGIVAGKADVEIDGTGTLECPYIETEGSVTIKDVTLKADASATEKPAISGKDVTIENATVDAVGGKSSPAIQADENLTITGGKVTAKAGETAPALTGQEVVMENKSEVDVDTEENQKAIVADRIVIDDATVEKDGAPAPDDIYSVSPIDGNGNPVNDPSDSGDDPSESGNDMPKPGGNISEPDSDMPDSGDDDISDPDDDVIEAEDLVVTANVKGVSNISAKGTLKLAPKKTMTLKVSFLPAGAETEKVTFKSSNLKVAKVSSKGKITAGKKAGKATITVKSDSFKKTFKVQVMKKAVSKIKIKAPKTTIKKKKTVKLKAVLSPGKKLASNTVYWKSSNKKIATVSSKGVVKGIKKGKVKITAIATDGSGKKKTITIRVK